MSQRILHHHLVLIVEGTEFGRQFEKISAQEMRFQLFGGLLQGEGKKAKLAGQGPLRIGFGRTGRAFRCAGFEPEFSKNAADAGDCVL